MKYGEEVTVEVKIENGMLDELRTIASELNWDLDRLLCWMLEDQFVRCQHDGWPSSHLDEESH